MAVVVERVGRIADARESRFHRRGQLAGGALELPRVRVDDHRCPSQRHAEPCRVQIHLGDIAGLHPVHEPVRSDVIATRRLGDLPFWWAGRPFAAGCRGDELEPLPEHVVDLLVSERILVWPGNRHDPAGPLIPVSVADRNVTEVRGPGARILPGGRASETESPWHRLALDDFRARQCVAEIDVYPPAALVDDGGTRVEPVQWLEHRTRARSRLRHHLPAEHEVPRLPGIGGADRSDDPPGHEIWAPPAHLEAIDVELDRQLIARQGGGSELRQYLRSVQVTPLELADHRLVSGGQTRVPFGGWVSLPEIAHRCRRNQAAEHRAIVAVDEPDLEPPDLGHELLLRVEIDDLRAHPLVGVGDAISGHGVIGCPLTGPEKCGADVAVEQPPAGIAGRIETLVRLAADPTVVGGVVVHRRRRRPEASGEVDPQRPEVAHAPRH